MSNRPGRLNLRQAALLFAAAFGVAAVVYAIARRS
jgi:hypothetical protein